LYSAHIVLQAGLFAAFLSAFLIFTITKLQPDSADISRDILLQISLQLSNSSVPAYVEPPFTVASDMAAVNVLLFASLAVILIDAYLAMLTKTWLRNFDRAWRSSSVPEERAKAREMRLQGLERWKLAEVVALLPLLTQASLILFGVALLVLLFNLHRPTAYVTFIILAAGFCFYACVTVISALDTTAPFTSPVSRILRVLIQRSRSSRVFSAILSCLKWCLGRTMHEDAGDEGPGAAVIELNEVGGAGGEGPEAAIVKRNEVEGADFHLAISNRLYTATSKVVGNLPVFTELFDQWVQTPSLHPQSMSHWRPILPLIQPYLSNAALYKDVGLRSVARLFLCSTSEDFPKGRQAVIAALRQHVKDTGESSLIEQLYIHLLHQPHSDWSLAGQVVQKLDHDMDTITELRWILNWIPLWFQLQEKQFPEIILSKLFRTSSMRGIVSFLCMTAVYVIHNQRVNDDPGLFNLLLLITRSIANTSGTAVVRHPNEIFKESQTNSGGIDAGLFISIGEFSIPPQRQWGFISDLYHESFTEAAGFRRDFTHLVILLMLSTLSTVEFPGADPEITYDSFIYPEVDLPALMDGLWETWQAPGTDHNLLIGIAVWLLKREDEPIEKPLPFQQKQMFEELLGAYDSITSGAISLMTPNAVQFIDAALSFNLKTNELSDTGRKWQPDTHNLKNPWLVMHIHNILGRDWCIPGGAMGGGWFDQVNDFNVSDWPNQQNWWEGLLDRVDNTYDRVKLVYDWAEQVKQANQLEQLTRFERLEGFERLKQFELFDRRQLFEGLERFERMELSELFKRLELFERLELRDLLDLLNRERRDPLDMEGHDLLEHAGSRWFHQPASPTALEMIARSRLNLYKHTELRPDPVSLTLFLCQRDKEIFNDSRRLLLKSFKPRSLPPTTTTEREVETARKLYSALFDSKEIGDLTKWRLLGGVLFPEWETLPTKWKDLLAAEVMREDWAEDQRVDWMARVVPRLGGRFSLYEFGLAKDDGKYERLAPTHLEMVATVVGYLGVEGLTEQKARELDRFLQQHKRIFHDERVGVESRDSDIVSTSTPSLQTGALNRIQQVISQVVSPNDTKTGPCHNPVADQEPNQVPSDVLESFAFSSSE
jgi:hypothetical protein